MRQPRLDMSFTNKIILEALQVLRSIRLLLLPLDRYGVLNAQLVAEGASTT